MYPVHTIQRVRSGDEPLVFVVEDGQGNAIAMSCTKLSEFKKWIEAFKTVGCPCVIGSSTKKTAQAPPRTVDVVYGEEEEEDDEDDEEKNASSDVDTFDTEQHIGLDGFRPLPHQSSDIFSNINLSAPDAFRDVLLRKDASTTDWDARFQDIVDRAGSILPPISVHDDYEDQDRSVRCGLELMRLQQDMARVAAKEVQQYLQSLPLRDDGERRGENDETGEFFTRDGTLWIRIVDRGKKSVRVSSSSLTTSDDHELDEDEEEEEDAEHRRCVTNHELRTSATIQDAIVDIRREEERARRRLIEHKRVQESKRCVEGGARGDPLFDASVSPSVVSESSDGTTSTNIGARGDPLFENAFKSSSTETVEKGPRGDSLYDSSSKRSTSTSSPRLSIMLQCIVDYLGFRAVVTAVPQRTFGEDVTDVDIVTESVKSVANKLNVRVDEMTRDDVIIRPTDGDRRYLLNVTYATPPDVPDENHTLCLTEQLKRYRLRASLVRPQVRPLTLRPYRVCEKELASGTFDANGIVHSRQDYEHDIAGDDDSSDVVVTVEEVSGDNARLTRAVGSKLRREGVRTFAAMLDSLVASTVFHSQSLAEYAHAFGINVRHFWLVRSYAKMPHVRRMLEIDMVARCLKRVLNRELRDLMVQLRNAMGVRTKAAVARRAVILANSALQMTINAVCDEECRRWWDDVLMPSMRRQFVHTSVCTMTYLPTSNPSAAMDMCVALTHACAYHCGLVIPTIERKDFILRRDADDSPTPSSLSFRIDRIRVVALRPRVKFMKFRTITTSSSSPSCVDRTMTLGRAFLLDGHGDASAVSTALLLSEERSCDGNEESERRERRVRVVRAALSCCPVAHAAHVVALAHETFALWDQDLSAKAEIAYRRTRDAMRRHGGESSPLLCIWPIVFAKLLLARASKGAVGANAMLNRSIELMKDSIRVGEIALLNDHWDFRHARAMLANVMSSIGRGDTDEGRKALRDAQHANRANGDTASSPEALYTLSRAFFGSARCLEAERHLRRCIRSCRSQSTSDVRTLVRARRLLATVIRQRDAADVVSAIAQLDQCVADLKRIADDERQEEKISGVLTHDRSPCVVAASNIFAQSISPAYCTEDESDAYLLRSTLTDLCGLIVSMLPAKTWNAIVSGTIVAKTAIRSYTFDRPELIQRVLSHPSPGKLIESSLRSAATYAEKTSSRNHPISPVQDAKVSDASNVDSCPEPELVTFIVALATKSDIIPGRTNNWGALVK